MNESEREVANIFKSLGKVKGNEGVSGITIMRRKVALWLHSFIDIGADISTSLKVYWLCLGFLSIYM